MSETSMVERVARALAVADLTPERQYTDLALAAIEAIRNADNDMLEAMHLAMFTDPFDGTNLPMLGAGFEAAIDAALSPNKEPKA